MIKINNINVEYYNNKVLDDFTLNIPFNSFVGIIGPNGAGKSTLIKSLLGIVKISSGNFLINDKSVSMMKKSIAYVPQKSEVDLSFPITVKELVLLGTYPKLKLFQKVGKKQRNLAHQAMKSLNILDIANKQINSLSGGQLQRAFIARALASEAEIYFLDEPFVGIDAVSESIIIKILKELHANKKTIIIVHHNLNDVKKYFEQLLILNKRLIAYGDVHDVFTGDNINKAYGFDLKNINIEGVYND